MFIPTKSDDQKLGNLGKKIKKIIKLNIFSLLPNSHASAVPSGSFCLVFAFFFLYVGPTCPFIPFLYSFQPRKNLFCLDLNFFYPN